MSKKTRDMFDRLKAGQDPVIADGARQAGSFLKEAGGAVWDGVAPMFNHGRSEAAAALFTGSAYVMYMKGEQVSSPDADRANEPAENEKDIGGREM